ncbi:MAG TPA: hypothetical protein PLY70_14095, partial [Saprospiraceae bacterium]|nr:hypothetical protein [Saprospiraceae bacterium]
MKINILSILLLLSIIDIAVCQCVEKPHVNPILYWDWRNEGLDTRSEELDGTGSFKFWQLGIDGDRKLKLNFSPFVSTSDQVNTLDFTVLKDYQPKDGWELVYRHFGETIPNVQQANITNNPAFALYNRFSGLLRIFIMTTYNPTAQTAVLELGFYKSGLQQKKSALLSFASDFPAAIEKFDNIISMKALNRAIGCDAPNGCRTWYYGDYYMAYDPCVCSNFSQLYFNLKQNTTTTMVSKTDGFASLVIDEGQVVSNAPNTLIGATSKVYDAWNAGKETSKTATELSEKANSFISDHVEFLSDNGLLSSSSYRKLKGVLDVAGNIGMVIGAANFLYTAFLGTSITGATAYAPQTFRLDYTTNTTSEDILYSGFNAFRVPGSPDGTGFEISGYQKPLYDHVLGVVSLMNSPKLEYAEYETDPVVVGMEWNVFTNSFVPVYKTPPPVREYHLKEDLKLAVNPASGLQITSVEGSFFWDESKLAPEDKNVDFVNSIRPIRHFGPFMLSGIPVSADLPNSCPVLSQPVDPHVSIDKMKLIELSEKSGYEVFLMKKGSSYDESLNRYFVKNVKFKTPNVDILYLRNQTFKLFYNGENPFISVRLNIFMRNNEDLTDKKVYIQTVTYQVLSEDINISSIGSSG